MKGPNFTEAGRGLSRCPWHGTTLTPAIKLTRGLVYVCRVRNGGLPHEVRLTYETADSCNCENTHCETGTHQVSVDEWTLCPEPGEIPARYVGPICPACAEYMPDEYLLREGVL